ncbi:MAG: hypothetical protein HGA24_05660 [Candidatus Aminicenantes bacterium]|nr:hypothetical protein [Candidatus Aminicenantes bacterium]
MGESKKLKPASGDFAYTAIKAAISLIPWVGGSTAEIFAAIVTPPLQKRRDQWIEDIAKGLEELREKRPGLDWDGLLKSDQFVTATLHATQTALKNHQIEKLEALRNAVLNASIGANLDEDLQMVFLRYIDELTPWHLRVLAYFHDPEAVWKKLQATTPNRIIGSIKEGVFLEFPELNKDRYLYQQLVADLKARGLLDAFEDGFMSLTGALTSRTSDLGKRFVAFIQSPL